VKEELQIRKMYVFICESNNSQRQVYVFETGSCSVMLTRSILTNHVSGNEKLKKSKKRDQTIIEAFRKENTQNKDSTFPVEERAYCLQVVQEFCY